MELNNAVCHNYKKKNIYRIDLLSKISPRNYIFIGFINDKTNRILKLIEKKKKNKY